MAETVASWLLAALGVYLGLGVLFAVPFVIWGVGRIDPQARGGSWGFRLLIIPGCAAFWPLLARRWMTGRPPPGPQTPHHVAESGGRA